MMFKLIISLLILVPSVLSACPPLNVLNETVVAPVYFPSLGSGSGSAYYMDNLGNMEFRAFMPSVQGREALGMGFGATPTSIPNCNNWSNGAVDNSTCESALSLVGPWNDIRECPGWVRTMSSDNSTIIFKNYVYVEWADVMENKMENIRTHRTLLAVTLTQQRNVIVEASTVPLTLEEARVLLTRIVYVPPGVDGIRRFEIDYTVVSPCPFVAYFQQVDFALSSPDNSTTSSASISWADQPYSSLGYQSTSSVGTCAANQRYVTHTGTLLVTAPSACWADSDYKFTFASISPAFTSSLVPGSPLPTFSVTHIALSQPNTGRDGLVYAFNGTHADYNQSPSNGTYATNNIFAWNDVVYFTDSTFPRIRKIQNGFVTTLVGSTSGFVDGAYASAKFTSLEDIVVDKSSGAIYVVDDGRVRLLFNGNVTTIAGTGTNIPFPGRQMQIDGAGNLYFISGALPDGVTSPQGQSIVKLNRTNNVWTSSVLAGSTTFGTADGNGTAAAFAFISSIAVSKLGIVYALEWSSVSGTPPLLDDMILRMILPDGSVTTLGQPAVSGYPLSSALMYAGILTNDVGDVVWYTDTERIWQMWPLLSGLLLSPDVSNMKLVATRDQIWNNSYIQGDEAASLTVATAKFPFTSLADMAYDNGRIYVVNQGDERIVWIGVGVPGEMETSARETPILMTLETRVEDGFNFCAVDSLSASVTASLSTLGTGSFTVGDKVNFAGNITTSGLPPAQIYLRMATVYNTKSQYASAGRYPKAVYQSATSGFSTFGTRTAFKAKFVDSLGSFFSGATDPELGGWASVLGSHLEENTDQSVYQPGVARSFLAQVTVVGGNDLSSGYLVPADYGTSGNGFSLGLALRVYFDLASASLGPSKRSDIQYLTTRQTEFGYTVSSSQAGDVQVESEASLQAVETFSTTSNVSTGLPIGATLGIVVGGMILIVAVGIVGVMVVRMKKRRAVKEPKNDKGLFMTSA
jgi:hypothetical protein